MNELDGDNIQHLSEKSRPKPVTVKIPKWLDDVLCKKAEEEGKSKTEIISDFVQGKNKNDPMGPLDDLELKQEAYNIFKKYISYICDDKYGVGVCYAKVKTLLDKNVKEDDLRNFCREVLDTCLRGVSGTEKRRILNLLMMDVLGVQCIIEEILKEPLIKEKIQNGIDEDINLLTGIREGN